MRVVIVSPRARVDLLEIWDYIAADDLQAADGMIDRIEQGIELLGEFPGAGHERAEVRRSTYRFWAVRPYLIVYRYTLRRVTVLRVVHGARDLRRALRQ